MGIVLTVEHFFFFLGEESGAHSLGAVEREYLPNSGRERLRVSATPLFLQLI